jgi:hypothetical protein
MGKLNSNVMGKKRAARKAAPKKAAPKKAAAKKSRSKDMQYDIWAITRLLRVLLCLEPQHQ